jgi:hypothetical protein
VGKVLEVVLDVLPEERNGFELVLLVQIGEYVHVGAVK